MIYFAELDTEQDKIRRLREELRWVQLMRKYSRESEPAHATHLRAWATGTPRRAKESIQHWKVRIRAAEIAFPGWGGGPPAIYDADDPLVEQEFEELERVDPDRFQACEKCEHAFWQSRRGESGGKTVCGDCEEAERQRRSRKGKKEARRARLAMENAKCLARLKRSAETLGADFGPLRDEFLAQRSQRRREQLLERLESEAAEVERKRRRRQLGATT